MNTLYIAIIAGLLSVILTLLIEFVVKDKERHHTFAIGVIGFFIMEFLEISTCAYEEN